MFLGLDLGTTNVKAVLAEPGGRIAGRGAAPVKLLHVEGGVEQDIDEIFSATLSAIRGLGDSADLAAVKAVGLSSQGGALQMLDGEGRPLGRVISWLDGRGKAYDEAIAREIRPEVLAARTGHTQGTMALGQMLRLRQESPGLLAPPNQIGFVGDVVASRLCGRRAHDATSLSCAVLYNPSRRRADPDMLKRVGISERQLPELLSPRVPAGGLLASVAESTSLPAGIPVSPPVHDQYAAATGVGATAPGDVMFGGGTAWVIMPISDRLMSPLAGAGFVCTHVVEGMFALIVSMGNGGSAVAWALKLTGRDGAGAEEIDGLLESVRPGADGLRCRPLMAPTGSAGLAGGTKGRITGLGLGHGPAHLLRAVVEGLAMELTRYLRMLTDSGVAVQRLVACGGAAASRVTPQIVADATGLPVACAAEPEASALGAAMLARGLIEPDTPLAEIASQMGPEVRLVEPSSQADFYRDMSQEYLASLPPAGAEGHSR